MKARAGFGIMVGIGAAGTAGAVLLAPISAFAYSGAASPAQTAQTAQSALAIGNKAKISARGAAIRIPYGYLCPAGWEGNLSVQVVEALGNDLASGYGNKNIKCSGEKKTAFLYVQVGAYQGARPFQPGPASLVATLDSYDPKADPCSSGPCPIMSEPKPPMGGMFNTASATGTPRATVADGDTNAHAEWQGTITLVD